MKNTKKLLREGLNKNLFEHRVSSLGLLLEKEIEVRDDLVLKLRNVNNPLSKKILSFLMSDNIKDTANVDYVDYDKNDETLITVGYENQRGDIKTNKLKITKLLKYLGSDTSDIKGYELEELISHFKKGDTTNLKLYSGEDILKIYHCKNYDDSGKGKNGYNNNMGSCMSGPGQQTFFKIYTENPNQVRILALINPDNGKVRGRALIWKMDSGELAMDRIYTVNKQYENSFKEYAEENNISLNVDGEVTLDNGGDFEEYPYMDNLMYYTPYDNLLSTSNGDLTLQSTNGLLGNWSEVYQEAIPEDESIYVDHIGDYVYSSDVEMNWEGEEFLYRDSEDVVYLNAGEYEGKYALLDDAEEYYKGGYALSSELEMIEGGDHSGEYAFSDELIETESGDYSLENECGNPTAGAYEGDVIHSEFLIVISKDYPEYELNEGDVYYELEFDRLFDGKEIETSEFEGPYLS